MLTIQPKITQYSQQRNNVSFKSREDAGIPDDAFYKEKQAYYENQIREFDTLIEDEHTPTAFKKVLKGFIPVRKIQDAYAMVVTKTIYSHSSKRQELWC